MSIIKKVITEGLEVVRDSAKQLAQTVSPDAFVKQALGQQPKNEFSEYLKNLGKDLSPQELEKKKQEFSTDEQKKMDEARKTITAAMPSHMRLPQKQQELRSQEVVVQDEERKKAMQVEAQKKNSQALAMPTSKQARGMLGGKKRSANKGFEGLQKDTKVG